MSSRAGEDQEPLIDATSQGTGRIEAFSDGVIAIAITLLVLEIKVPQVPEGLHSSLTDELLKLWPSYGSFLTSFLIIGIIWINHHQMYKMIERTNHAFLALNVIFLMVISFLPFPTGVLAEYLREGREQQAATILYVGSQLAMAITYNLLWRYASYNSRLLDRKISAVVIRDFTRKFNSGLALYLTAFILAFISYEVSLGLTVVLAIYFLLPSLPSFGRRR